jgi:hypothetical protein
MTMTTNNEPNAKDTPLEINTDNKPTPKRTTKSTDKEIQPQHLPVKVEKAPLMFFNRPVEPSHIQVIRTINSAGIRPIAASNIQILNTVNFVGSRPVSVSNLHIVHLYNAMGSRPVADNETENMDVLIGYLD